MPATFTIKIPTKPHYRKFVEKEFSSKIDTRYSVNVVLSVLVHTMLRKAPLKSRSNQQSELQGSTSKFTDFLQIEVPEHRLFNNEWKSDLTYREIIQLNYALEALFKRELFKYVELKRGSEETMVIIERWMDKYGITESDISFDALKKAEYRHRKSLEVNFSTSCPTQQ